MTPEQIKQARAKTGLSQAKFAALLGVNTRTVEKWESGQRSPSATAIKLIEMVTK